MTMEDVPTSSRSGFALTFSEEITEPTIAEPRAAVVAVEDEQTSAPTSTPEPVATEEELALEWLRENPNFHPQIGGARDRSVFSLRRTNQMPFSPANLPPAPRPPQRSGGGHEEEGVGEGLGDR